MNMRYLLVRKIITANHKVSSRRCEIENWWLWIYFSFTDDDDGAAANFFLVSKFSFSPLLVVLLPNIIWNKRTAYIYIYIYSLIQHPQVFYAKIWCLCKNLLKQFFMWRNYCYCYSCCFFIEFFFYILIAAWCWVWAVVGSGNIN